MKLTPTWENADIKHGMIVYCHNDNPKDNLGYMLSTAHIIGWDTGCDDDEYTFTSLADGMTARWTPTKLLSVLNKQPYIPMPSSHLQSIMGYKVPLV